MSTEERLGILETHIAYTREAVDRIEQKLDKLNGCIDDHQSRITRVETVLKILAYVVGGGGVSSGAIIGILKVAGLM